MWVGISGSDKKQAVVRKLFKIHGIILSYFTYHFNPIDNYEISNLSEVSHNDFMQRILCLFENFGLRQLPESMFDDDIRQNSE